MTKEQRDQLRTVAEAATPDLVGTEQDAEFFATFYPEIVIKLLDYIDALETENKELREALDKATEGETK